MERPNVKTEHHANVKKESTSKPSPPEPIRPTRYPTSAEGKGPQQGRIPGRNKKSLTRETARSPHALHRNLPSPGNQHRDKQGTHQSNDLTSVTRKRRRSQAALPKPGTDENHKNKDAVKRALNRGPSQKHPNRHRPRQPHLSSRETQFPQSRSSQSSEKQRRISNAHNLGKFTGSTGRDSATPLDRKQRPRLVQIRPTLMNAIVEQQLK